MDSDNGTAVSEESQSVDASLAAVRDHQENSLALNGEKSAAISSLLSLFSDHGSDGWDGANARALNGTAVQQAIALIRSLPDDLPLPEVAVDVDGGVSLDWMPDRLLAVSVGINATNRIGFAWLNGRDRGNAVARFDGVIPPRTLLDLLTHLMSSRAALRIA